jgi:hypothetical protein
VSNIDDPGDTDDSITRSGLVIIVWNVAEPSL